MFTLAQALAAIEDKPEFTCRDKGSYSVIDYNLNSKTTFVGKDDEETRILLNLRGTAFDNETGKIIRLGFPKFFNLGEFPETDAQLDFGTRHLITQKVDGSCIFPIYIPEQSFVLGTRAGVTDISQMATDFIADKPHYSKFINDSRDFNITPIFEFCSRKNRVVIDYPEDMLILTGLRYISDGRHISRSSAEALAEQYKIPLVRQLDSIDSAGFTKFQESVKNLVDDEGVVITFSSGHMIKLKSEQYCDRHRAVDSLKWDHDCVKLIVTGLIDDVIPMLAPDRARFIQKYAEGLLDAIDWKVKDIMSEFENLAHIKDRKAFAAAVLPLDTKAFMFKLFVDPSYNIRDGLLEYAKRMTNNQANVKELKNFIGYNQEYNE
jgi:T4 RnlA family RNA ligase